MQKQIKIFYSCSIIFILISNSMYGFSPYLSNLKNQIKEELALFDQPTSDNLKNQLRLINNQSNAAKLQLIVKPIFDGSNAYPLLSSYNVMTLVLLAHATIKHAELLESTILQILDILHEDLNYWQKLSSQSSIFTAASWGTPDKKTIKNNILFLNQEIKAHYYNLGYLDKSLQHCKTITTKDQLIAHMNSMVQIVDNCLRHNHQTTSSTTMLSPIDSAHALIHNLQRIEQYQKQAYLSRGTAAKPGHVQRHWLGYSIGLMGFVAASMYWYKNKEVINQWALETKKAGESFCTTYIVERIKNFLDIIYGKKEEWMIHPEALKSDAETLARMSKAYLQDRTKLSETEIAQRVKTIVETRNMGPEFSQELAVKSQHPGFYFVMDGEILRLYSLEYQTNKLKAEDVLCYLDRIKQTQQLNLELVASLPIISLVWATGRLIKKTLTRQNYQSLATLLRTMEQIFNQHLNDQQVDYDTQGSLVYLISKIKSYLNTLPPHDRVTFAHDIAELESPTFTLAQKLNSIARIHRTYTFLQPTPQ